MILCFCQYFLIVSISYSKNEDIESITLRYLIFYQLIRTSRCIKLANMFQSDDGERLKRLFSFPFHFPICVKIGARPLKSHSYTPLIYRRIARANKAADRALANRTARRPKNTSRTLKKAERRRTKRSKTPKWHCRRWWRSTQLFN